jgi:hypothetical protein
MLELRYIRSLTSRKLVSDSAVTAGGRPAVELIDFRLDVAQSARRPYIHGTYVRSTNGRTVARTTPDAGSRRCVVSGFERHFTDLTEAINQIDIGNVTRKHPPRHLNTSWMHGWSNKVALRGQG